MATILASAYLTLADVATRTDSSGQAVRDIINLLSQTNEILDDMLWTECNDGTTHLTTVRTGLPAAAWRLLNYGVPVVKSTTAQIRDTVGMLEAYSQIDRDLADLEAEVMGGSEVDYNFGGQAVPDMDIASDVQEQSAGQPSPQIQPAVSFRPPTF